MPVLVPRRVALVAVAIAALTGAAYFAFRPTPPPSAPAAPPPAALLLVDPRPPGLLPGGPVVTPGEIEAYRKTQAALVKSDFVLNAALRDPKAREAARGQADAPAWLAGRLTADYGENSSVLRISVGGVPPRDAAALANAVADAYLREVVQAEIQSLRARGRKLEDARDTLRRPLDARRGELRRLADEAGVPPDRADQSALLASLYQERAGLRVELAKARAGEDPCAEEGAREKPLRDDLAALDARIKACEQANLDPARAEVARLEAAVSSVNAELTRLELDMNSPRGSSSWHRRRSRRADASVHTLPSRRPRAPRSRNTWRGARRARACGTIDRPTRGTLGADQKGGGATLAASAARPAGTRGAGEGDRQPRSDTRGATARPIRELT